MVGERLEGSGAKSLFDKFMVYDFFFVLFALVWFFAGVATRVSDDEPGPILGAWAALWPVVFQPAIGLLMLGALSDGLLNWFKENYGFGAEKN